jgi:hypothetical protein
MEMLDHADPRFPKGGPNIEEDMLARQKRAHARRVDEREEFQREEVTISTGPKNTAVVVALRWPRSAYIQETRDDLDNVVHRERVWTGGRFVFAVYSDNPDWHKAARDEWEAGARNALEKFCAMRNLSIVQGPRPEDTNRYNVMVETREPINAT